MDSRLTVSVPLADLPCQSCRSGSECDDFFTFDRLQYQLLCIDVTRKDTNEKTRVTLDVKRVRWQKLEKGRYTASAVVHFPCPYCDKATDLYYALEAPQIFLVNHIRCRDCGGELVLENEELEYTDENACVRIVGTMTCKPCGSKQPHESLTVLSDTRSLAKAKAVRLDVRHEKTTLTVPPDDRQSVLISYSHKDRIWLERLQTHLAPLQRNGLFDLWDDTRIQAGERWKEEIAAALSNSKVAILLVTPHFLASDFIAENELPQLIDLAREQRLAILWIAVSASLYSETPIAELQAVNDPSRPLDTLSSSERSRVMVEICRQVQNAIRDGQGM